MSDDQIFILELFSILMAIYYISITFYLKILDIIMEKKIKKMMNKIKKENDEYYLKILKEIRQEIKESPLYLYYQHWIKN